MREVGLMSTKEEEARSEITLAELIRDDAEDPDTPDDYDVRQTEVAP